MNSRTDKYYDENTSVGSRTARNTNLYKEINKTELDNFELRSNATVIGNNRGSIDVEKIKSILDTHYNDVPKRRSIKIDEIPKEEEKTKPVFETKEYDINVILDKAKEEKTENYSEERAKKLRDTQFDILSNLNIDPKDYIEDYDGDSEFSEEKNSTAKKLEELINTINLNEKDIAKAKKNLDNDIQEISNQNKQEKTGDSTDPLDIFADLKGSENTTILEGLQEKTENLIKKMEETTSLDNSFFTKSNSFKKSDFEDFKDIEGKEVSPFVKIIIVVLVLIFIIGLAVLVKSLFI